MKAQEAFLTALPIARQQDRALEMETLVSDACVDNTNFRLAQSLERNLEAIELAGQTEKPIEESHARYDLMNVQLAIGKIDEASSHAEAMFEPAKRSGVRLGQARAMAAQENVHSARGDFHGASTFIERALTLLPEETVLLGCRAVFEYQKGDFTTWEEYLEKLLATFASVRTAALSQGVLMPFFTVPAVVVAFANRITGVLDRLEWVETIANSVLESSFSHPGPATAARIGLAL